MWIVIEKVRVVGVFNDSIDWAIVKGVGIYEDGESNYEEMCYEGYGLGGVVVLIEVFIDNCNCMVVDLWVVFSKKGGNLGEIGCVSWMFS